MTPIDPALIDIVQGRVGSTLSRKWVLGPIIGAGGTAAIYEATHRTNGRRVAVKVMHASLASWDDAIARFRREGYIANKVGHPGAVSILDDDTTEDGAPYIVMERLDGEPLSRLVDHATDGLAVGQALSIAYEVLDILAAAHAQGIIHRDIKPDNVFLTTSGTIMLLDFGIARLRELLQIDAPSGRGDQSHGASTHTREGSTLGTPQYMSPEQARGRWKEVDAQSDLWSVGAMMFTLLTGKHVRERRDSPDMLLAAMTEPARSILTVGAVPADVAAIVDRALAFDKRERWPDARAMQAAIRQVTRREGATDPLPMPVLPPPTPELAAAPRAAGRTSRAMVTLAGATLVLAGLALALEFFDARGGDRASMAAPAVTAIERTLPVIDLGDVSLDDAASAEASPEVATDPSAPSLAVRPAHPVHHPHASPPPPPEPVPPPASSSPLSRRH